MTKKLKVGVIGVGYLGRFHALIYARMPGVELVGVVDADRERAEVVAAEAGCAAVTDPQALLGRVEAISIVVPTSLHLEIARPFLEAGIPMLLEKPIAPSMIEAETLVKLAEERDVLLQIGHLERFNAGVMALAERIDNPRFIEAHRMSSFSARATDVDVISDLMIHDIDIILSLVGSPIRAISASGTPVLTDHIDIANARLDFENGCVANITASRVSEKQSRRIRVFSPQHYHSLDFIDQRIDVAYPQPVADQAWPEIVAERIQVEPVKPLDAELDAFVNSCRTGQPPLVDGRVGLAALDAALRVKATILNHS